MDGEGKYAGRRVALLIDGDNLNTDHLPAILKEASGQGSLAVRRVYGDVTRLPAWEGKAGFRMIHSGCAKNAADMLLTIDAMQLAYEGKVEAFVIASSDRDFSHLVHHLRERGHAVIGIGEAKTHDTFRKACVRFVEIGPAKQVEVAVRHAPPRLNNLDSKIVAMIQTEGHANGMAISLLGGRMGSQHKIAKSELPHGDWRSYLDANAAIYVCDPRSSDARVRLAFKPPLRSVS